MAGEFWELGDVADVDLQSSLLRLLSVGARTEASVIAHLAAVEVRALHLEAGSSSMFDYCCTRLGLSESEAFHRLTAARLARRFPLVFTMISERSIHLSGVCLLRDFLTPENHKELLAEAAGKTKLKIQELLARRFPRADVASTIRKLPGGGVRARGAGDTDAVPQLAEAQSDRAASDRAAGDRAASDRAASDRAADPASLTLRGSLVAQGSTSGAARAPRFELTEPLSAARYRIQLNASADLKAKLDLALDLLSHANPSRDLATVIERAVDLLIEHTQKRRFGQTKRARRERPATVKDPAERAAKSAVRTKASYSLECAAKENAPDFRARRGHVPNTIKRQIIARDGMRCTYVGQHGERCTETKLTQIHHEQPWARGGGETIDNLRLLCAAHNRFLAERDFGEELVAARIEQRRADSDERAAARLPVVACAQEPSSRVVHEKLSPCCSEREPDEAG